MTTTVALYGAAGKMGTRIAEKLAETAEYQVLHVESGEEGLSRLLQAGRVPVAGQEAARRCEAAVLAVPDRLIGRVAAEVVPALPAGAMLVCLDPAAPYAGELPERQDVTYFVTHPCHPPIVNDETDPEARTDCFGGVAKQHVVAALMQGPEEAFEGGEKLARAMFAPVMNVHRVTVEQMVMLEPALSETVVLTLMVAIREAVDEAVERGVPAQAARDFVLGHMHVNVGILFGFIDAEVSEGAKLAADRGAARLLRPDWKEAFEPENVRQEVLSIVRGVSE
ncbi:MAG: phosphogluconate dehydrogenase C-terminal domain-containing protein [Planctomycetota bacterium]